MLQTVLLCLRLDSPALSETLTLPSFPPGDGAPSSAPPAKPWLSRSLRSLLEQQENTALQEMLLVENVYLIGDAVKIWSCFHFESARRSCERKPADCGCGLRRCRGVHGADRSTEAVFVPLCPRRQIQKCPTYCSRLLRQCAWCDKKSKWEGDVAIQRSVGTNRSHAKIWGNKAQTWREIPRHTKSL